MHSNLNLPPSPHDPTKIICPSNGNKGSYQFLPRSTSRIHKQHADAAPRNKDTDSLTHLKERCYRAKRVPQHRGEVRHRLALLAQLQQCILPCLGAGQLIDPLVNLFTVNLSQCCWHRLGGRQESFSPNISSSSHPNRSHNLPEKLTPD